MKGEDLDGYIAQYEALTLEAGYQKDDPLCLRKFTDCYVPSLLTTIR